MSLVYQMWTAMAPALRLVYQPGVGGVPGSHKSNLPCPQEILDWEERRELIHQPPAKAGDVILFNEACIHGTLPWTAAHERRALLYRYSPKVMTVGGGLGADVLPEGVHELRPEQRAVMGPPSILDPPIISDDGVLQPPRPDSWHRPHAWRPRSRCQEPGLA